LSSTFRRRLVEMKFKSHQRLVDVCDFIARQYSMNLVSA
jgi:hypothetical protein